MKRALHFFFYSSLLLATSRCIAQQEKYLGVVLGANFANESIDSLPGGTPAHRTGILAGLQFDRWLNSQWGLGWQIVYAQEGRNEDLYGAGTGIFSGFTRTGSVTIQTQYIDASLLVKKTIVGNNVWRAYAFAGPAAGFFLSGSVHSNLLVSKPGSASFGGDTTYALQCSSMDFSIHFGLGACVQLGSGAMVVLDASYWYGLTNNFESYGGATYTRDPRVTAGILFPIHLPSLF
jgi:hypothetical protein